MTTNNKVSYANANVTGFAPDFIGTYSINGDIGLRIRGDNNIHMGVESDESLNYNSPTNIIAIGKQALSNVDSGDDLIAIGENTLSKVESGSNNIGIGESAGQSASGLSSRNIAIGGESLSDAVGGVMNDNVVMGYGAGIGLRTGSSNNIIGHNAATQLVGGSNNVAIGENAGVGMADTSTRNIAVGNDSLSDATGGVMTDNVVIGHNAGSGLQTGNSNNIIGHTAAVSLVSGSSNIAIGDSALHDTTTGGSNIAIGTDAGVGMTGSSEENVIVGRNALSMGTSVLDRNVAIGVRALRDYDGSGDTAVGFEAARAYTGSSTTAIGNSCLRDATSSTSITAVGDSACMTLINSNACVGVGRNVFNGNDGSANSVVVGDNAGMDCIASGTVIIGEGAAQLSNVADLVGCIVIGRNAFDVSTTNTVDSAIVIGRGAATGLDGVNNIIVIGNGSATNSGTSGNNNIIIGHDSGTGLTTSVDNIIIGNSAGNTIDFSGNSSENILIGRTADIGTVTDDEVIVFGNTTSEASHEVKFANTYTQIRMRGMGNHGGGAAVTRDGGNGVIRVDASAAKYKKDIQDIDVLFDTSLVYNLQPRTFTFQSSPDDSPSYNQIGIVADEGDPYIPYLTIRGQDGEIESFSYLRLPVIMLNEMKKEKPGWDRTEQRFVSPEIDLSQTSATDVVVSSDFLFYPDRIDIIQMTEGTGSITLQFGDVVDPVKYGSIVYDAAGSQNRTIIDSLTSYQAPTNGTLRITVSAGVPSAGTCKVCWRGLKI